MNKDEAIRCLAISKDKFNQGNLPAALKFAKKSIDLCETPQGREWLKELRELDSKRPGERQGERSGENLRRRKSQSEAAPKSEQTERQYTQEQVAGIKRILQQKKKGDLYGILGLEKGCSDAEIKKAYRRMALAFHPDKCGAPGTDDAFKGPWAK